MDQSKAKYFPHIPPIDSKSFHSTVEGKYWTRLLINLCWWLHDMYEIDSTDSDAKFQYIEQQINHCHSLFPAKFTLIFSDPKFSPTDQHPLLICRQEEYKIVIVVFRATVSSKSIQDIFTDINIFANHQVYLGARHAGFAQRAETAPLIAITNWLRRGRKVLITGHSLGGAVSQLFTAKVIDKLNEAGISPSMVFLRCITFGTPQCADHHFWSSYTEWYNVFDTYIYEDDVIFRMATFGTHFLRRIIESFVQYIHRFTVGLSSKIIRYNINDQTNSLVKADDQIHGTIPDALLPIYSIFGRHHFIRKNQKSQLKIYSIGELEDEKYQLLTNLNTGHFWYDYFIEKQMIVENFHFIYRQFMEHGCYPNGINQLFNHEIGSNWDRKRSQKQELFRVKTNNYTSDISAFIHFPDESSLCCIYFHGFLADFISSVEIPNELAESEEFKKKIPMFFPDQPDICAVSCVKSNTSVEYLKKHLSFTVHVTSYLGLLDVQVVVLTNLNSITSSIYQLNPIETILRAYQEFILDTTSIENIDSSLTRCFSLVFNAFKRIGQNKFDTIMARYWAEAEACNFFSDIEKHIQTCLLPQTDKEVQVYFDQLLLSLEKTTKDIDSSPEMKQNARFLQQALETEVYGVSSTLILTDDEFFADENPSTTCVENKSSVENVVEFIPLYLNFSELRKCLCNLHADRDISSVQQNFKIIRASYFFIIIKLRRLQYIKHYTSTDKLSQALQIFWSKKRSLASLMTGVGGSAALTGMSATTIAGVTTGVATDIATKAVFCTLAQTAASTATGAVVAATAATILPSMLIATGIVGAAYSTWYAFSIRNQLYGEYEKMMKPFIESAVALLASTGSYEVTDEHENEWQILDKIDSAHWSRQLAQAKSREERDVIWNQTFTKEPLKNIFTEDRWLFVGIVEICCQLVAMRRLLARQPPKLLIVGQSQTGKSTLFKHLTGYNLEELSDIDKFNTRMLLQCSASIKLSEKSSSDLSSNGSILSFNVIDSPGCDDAARQSDIFLSISLKSAHLVIIMTTLTTVNHIGTIDLLDKILFDTKVNVLVLINQVDIRLKDTWEKFKKQNSIQSKDSDDDESDEDESGEDEIHEVFNHCETLDRLIERPIQELIQQLKAGAYVVQQRVAFQPVILKGLKEYRKTFDEPLFQDKVHKSNVNKWIKQNLINTNL